MEVLFLTYCLLVLFLNEHCIEAAETCLTMLHNTNWYFMQKPLKYLVHDFLVVHYFISKRPKGFKTVCPGISPHMGINFC